MFTLIFTSWISVTLVFTMAVARMVRFCKGAMGVPAAIFNIIFASFVPGVMVIGAAVRPLILGGKINSTLKASA